MHRLVAAALAAVDAAITAAVGLVVLLAPLTVLWAIAVGSGWGALWPTTAVLWQYGHGAPVQIEIPVETAVALGVPAEAAGFTLSVIPLAFLLGTLLAAFRSGRRAARSGAWPAGVITGTLVFGAIAVLIARTGVADVATTPTAFAVIAPTAAYLVGSLAGAVRHAWTEGDEGLVDRLHDAVDQLGDEWSPVPSEIVRGTAFVAAALFGVGAIAVALMTLLRAGEVVALFSTARVDALGVVVLTLGALAYLPTLIVWAVSWIAGPGFAIGTGTAVSPAGTQLGVVPGVPVFGLIPEVGSFWMLIVVLVPVAAGAVAGWAVRSRLVWEGVARHWPPRAAIAGGIALLSAGIAALAGWGAAGSIGPGRLAEAGPHVGWFALAIGVEVLLGASILLLAPRNRAEVAEERVDRWTAQMGASPLDDSLASAWEPASDAAADDRAGAGHGAASLLGDDEETAPLDGLTR